MSPDMERPISAKEAAAFLGYHPQTMWRKIRRGEIPGVERYGRSIRIDKAAIERGPFHVARTIDDECKQK